MLYSIAEAIALIRRWKDSASIVRVTYADIATGGTFLALVVDVPDKQPSAALAASASFKVVLPNGISGGARIDVNFWGSEEIDFTDFTDEPPDTVLADDMDRVTSCISIKYEAGSIVTLCEAWPDPRLDTVRSTNEDLAKALLAQRRQNRPVT